MLIDSIFYLVPKAQVVIVGEPANADEYQSQVEWRDERPQPSWAEIQNAKPEADKVTANRKTEITRRTAFQTEADPLFFEWQRGENTEQAWRDKCAEIRARYPYV